MAPPDFSSTYFLNVSPTTPISDSLGSPRAIFRTMLGAAQTEFAQRKMKAIIIRLKFLFIPISFLLLR
jgi:hypothetical protein